MTAKSFYLVCEGEVTDAGPETSFDGNDSVLVLAENEEHARLIAALCDAGSLQADNVTLDGSVVSCVQARDYNRVILHDGKRYILAQQAYVSDDGTTYEAHAYDARGKEYQLYWTVISPCTDGDEGSACDWGNPSRIVAL